MTHELLNIIESVIQYQEKGMKCVLVTVVDLEGSSYRKPGVRMLLTNHGSMVGAVSGGCVEKEIIKRAQSVFTTGTSKVMVYDGRYRLGCEGSLYILIEPIFVSDILKETLFENIKNRNTFTIKSFFKKDDDCVGNFGSVISFKNNESYTFSDSFCPDKLEVGIKIFTQILPPCFKLLIIGGEHDAVKLCNMAALLGWEVEVITSMSDPKGLKDFPGAKSVIACTPETFTGKNIDDECAVVLMTHNYAQDLRYLLKLKEYSLSYIGILGSVKRRHQLQNELFEYVEDLDENFIESIHSPAGLNIGAITPEEIALSILSEILAVTRNKEPFSLKVVNGKLHC
ncbi:XdhC family protein [Seonamhaeicola aphaedonensis]|uniref:Xanthine/CO dehydrogenase XdhC/CoxF family maturation factor n=1 Tax=Seonamhaeicola aphaedonensis TaxID=1461338 RepID=A0A3D9HD45_9FLAO|nr:XdhC/CoxI family protein [Seonamhaeicola aphaedonensis]RED47385.1 xanthine/CO dehydrogenase XdhC/CoxF family maturation factor [Seonamhaeicola aphaedonensis]